MYKGRGSNPGLANGLVLLLRSWQRNASVVGLSDFGGKKEREEKGREEGEFFVQKSEVAKIAEATSNAQKRRHRR